MKKVSVRTSMIPGSGMGLFADEHIRKGELIVMVIGEKYTSQSESPPENSFYLLDCGDGSNDYIDVKGPAMYANDACGLVRIEGVVNNSLFRMQEDGTMWLEANRAIRTGQEIFASYGRAYWTAIRHMQKAAKTVELSCQ